MTVAGWKCCNRIGGRYGWKDKRTNNTACKHNGTLIFMRNAFDPALSARFELFIRCVFPLMSPHNIRISIRNTVLTLRSCLGPAVSNTNDRVVITRPLYTSSHLQRLLFQSFPLFVDRSRSNEDREITRMVSVQANIKNENRIPSKYRGSKWIKAFSILEQKKTFKKKARMKLKDEWNSNLTFIPSRLPPRIEWSIVPCRYNRPFVLLPFPLLLPLLLRRWKKAARRRQSGETGNFEVALRNLLPFLPRKVPAK